MAKKPKPQPKPKVAPKRHLHIPRRAAHVHVYLHQMTDTDLGSVTADAQTLARTLTSMLAALRGVAGKHTPKGDSHG